MGSELKDVLNNFPKNVSFVEFLRKFADVHSGGYYVSPESLKKVMASLGERLTHEEVEEMMRMADTNQDGLLHYEEFRDFLDKL